MDIRQEETIVENPEAGVTQVVQTTEQTASKGEVLEAKADKKNQILWYVIGLICTLLALRVVFLLLGAREIGFASALYSITDPFVAPFRGIFASPAVSGAYFDSAAVVAIIIYALIGWGISALIDLMNRPAPTGR